MKVLSFLSLCCCFFNCQQIKATTFTVSNLTDSGTGSFRQAITDANAASGSDIIDFTVSGNVILSAALPQITDSLLINGNTAGNSIRRDFINGPHRILDIANGSHVTINRLTLFGGSIVTGNGAGILIQSNCVVEMNDCCIRNCFANTASYGGGIFVANLAKLTLTNCTVSDNSMTLAGGGGMVSDFGSDVTLVHCTFSHNTAGAILNYSSNLKMTNTILANSSPDGTADFTNTGAAVAVNNNNIVESCASGTSCTVFFSNTDPSLGGLSLYNSGPTETRFITSVSIAYNAGAITGIVNDQNGTPRDAMPDIGAYEVPGATGIVPIQNPMNNQCNDSDLGNFNLQVIDISGRIVFEKKYDMFWQTKIDVTDFETNNSALHNGIYILKMTSENKTCLTKMIHAH